MPGSSAEAARAGPTLDAPRHFWNAGLRCVETETDVNVDTRGVQHLGVDEEVAAEVHSGLHRLELLLLDQVHVVAQLQAAAEHRSERVIKGWEQIEGRACISPVRYTLIELVPLIERVLQLHLELLVEQDLVCLTAPVLLGLGHGGQAAFARKYIDENPKQ